MLVPSTMIATVFHRCTANHYRTNETETYVTPEQHRIPSPEDTSVKVPLAEPRADAPLLSNKATICFTFTFFIYRSYQFNIYPFIHLHYLYYLLKLNGLFIDFVC